MTGLCQQASAGVGVMEPAPGDQLSVAALLRRVAAVDADHVGGCERVRQVSAHSGGAGQQARGRCGGRLRLDEHRRMGLAPPQPRMASSEVPQMLTQAGLRRVAPSLGAGSSGAGPPHDTPGAQRPRTAPGRAPPRSVGGPGSPFSLGQLLEHRLVQLRLRQKLLQPGVLHLQLLEPPRVAGAHPRIGPAPATPDLLGGRLTAPSDDDGNREAPLNQVVSQSLRSATWHGYRSSVGLTGVRSTRRRRPQLAPQRRREEAPTQ